MHVATITIDHTKVAGDLTDYVVAVITNSDAGWSTLYAIALEGGGDIRTYKAGGSIELPRENVSFSVSAETGEIHIKYTGTLSGSVDTDIEIHADGSSSEPAVGSTYGRNETWSDYVSVLHFQDNLTDSSGTEDPTGGGTITYDSTNSVAGKSVTTTGVVEYTSTFASNHLGANYTIQTYFHPTSNGTGDYLGYNWSTPARNIFSRRDGDNTFQSYSGGAGSQASILRSSAFANNTDWWTYLVREAQTLKHYKNATVDVENLSLGTANDGIDTGTIFLFSLSRSGNLDEYRIRPSALPLNWISTERENQSSPTTFYSVVAEEASIPQNSNFLMFM